MTATAQAFAPPRSPVLPPPYVPRQFGLLSVATLPEPEDHWSNGVVAIADPHAAALSYVDYCLVRDDDGAFSLNSPDDRTKTVDTGVNVIQGDPFTLYGGFTCGPAAFGLDEIDQRAQAHLTGGEERTLERLVLDGASDNGETVHPNVTDDASVSIGTFTSLTSAIGALEQAIDQQYGGQGALLVPRRAIATLANGYELNRTGGLLSTLLGNKVAAVDDGEQPDEETVTIVGLGAIAIRRGVIVPVGTFASSLDRADNTVTRIMERTYVVLIDGPLLTVEVTMTGFPA